MHGCVRACVRVCVRVCLLLSGTVVVIERYRRLHLVSAATGGYMYQASHVAVCYPEEYFPVFPGLIGRQQLV